LAGRRGSSRRRCCCLWVSSTSCRWDRVQWRGSSRWGSSSGAGVGPAGGSRPLAPPGLRCGPPSCPVPRATGVAARAGPS
jgi:hypothetical protein